MNLSKIELASKRSSDVRHNELLFDLFKKYILEDWGNIPAGCFGCDFNKHFQKWSEPYLTKKKVELKKRENMAKDYILKDENYKTFYKGEVLSKNSSSEEWAEFINENEAQVEKRKSLFKKLPSSISTDTEKEVENEIIEEEEIEKKPESAPLVDAKEDVIVHTVTQEDLDNNPGLEEEGVQVGDQIILDSTEDENSTAEEDFEDLMGEQNPVIEEKKEEEIEVKKPRASRAKKS
jgi:hypothetical protein